MIVRKIKDSELKRTNELFGISFEIKVDNSLSSDDYTSKAISNPSNRGDIYLTEKWAAFDENNNMMAFIATIPYEVRFDGNHVKMTGIGGVSTLPQYRRNGAIRECFNKSLRNAYLNGVTFSYLYPFSTAYYRKFGYELCGEVMRYSINLKSIKRFDEANGQVFLVENGSHLDDFKKVYDDFAERYNLMCVRSDIDYNFIKKSNPANDGHYIYIYKSKDGEPKGIITFEKVKTDNHFDLECRNFFFSDIEGFKGIINHTLAFSSYYEHCVFKLPININISSYIPEWALFTYRRECIYNGMVRIVDVKKSLVLAKYAGSGEIIILIEDKQILENNNTFKVVFKDNRAIEVIESTEKCDIEMSINDFSRLLIGTHAPEEIKYIENVKIYSEFDKIAKVFYKKPNFIADYF